MLEPGYWKCNPWTNCVHNHLEFVRNPESQVSPQTYWVKTNTSWRAPGASYTLSSLRRTALATSQLSIECLTRLPSCPGPSGLLLTVLSSPHLLPPLYNFSFLSLFYLNLRPYFKEIDLVSPPLFLHYVPVSVPSFLDFCTEFRGPFF